MRRKEFDCLREKDEIQRRLTEEIRDLPWEERWRRAEEALEADPLLARLLPRRADDTKRLRRPGRRPA